MTHTVFDSTTLAQWTKDVMDDHNNNVDYKLHDPEPSAITLNTGGASPDEMIRIDQDGFYVRGKKVPVDDREAETVYLAFKQWLAWANLQRR